MVHKLVFIIYFLLSFFNVTAEPTASRTVGGDVYFYESLHEAFHAASGESIEFPDLITLLSDVVLDKPIIIDSHKHIRLVAAGSRTVMRGSGNLEYPLFWIRGRSASLSLGDVEMEGELSIDGGYLNIPGIIAHSPLITLNGPGSRLMIHDHVYLQNNYNNSPVRGTGDYQLGSGVFIRTLMEHTADLDNKAEFIMKGGVIRGNTINNQDIYPNGGGVLAGYYGIFTMEGGVIMNNTAFRLGGGVHIDTAGSFRKTGGTIYGINADDGDRNIAINGNADPQYFGHAVAVFSYTIYSRFVDHTVGEYDNLSYTGQTSGIGVFGEGEKWSANAQNSDVLEANVRLFLVIGVLSLAALLILIPFILIKRVVKKPVIAGQAQDEVFETFNLEPGVKLSPREKQVFNLFISGLSAKEAASRMGLTISSINLYSTNLYRKLGINSRTELLVKYKR